jgi:hypothetical protein
MNNELGKRDDGLRSSLRVLQRQRTKIPIWYLSIRSNVRRNYVQNPSMKQILSQFNPTHILTLSSHLRLDFKMVPLQEVTPLTVSTHCFLLSYDLHVQPIVTTVIITLEEEQKHRNFLLRAFLTSSIHSP